MADLPPPPPALEAPAPLPFLQQQDEDEPERSNPLRPDRVDPGEEPSDFDLGDLEVKLRLGFSGNSLGPQTLFTAFLNWFELQGNVDYGVYQKDYLTVGVGVEAWLGRPVIPEAISNLESGEGLALDWRSTSRGLAFRTTAHYTWLSSFDPYLVALAGPTLDTVYARRTDRAGARGRITSGGMRIGVGGGINVVSQDRIMGGLELRYLVGTRFRSGADVPITDADGTEIDSFDVGRAQRPPRGFSYVFFVGMRF